MDQPTRTFPFGRKRSLVAGGLPTLVIATGTFFAVTVSSLSAQSPPPRQAKPGNAELRQTVAERGAVEATNGAAVPSSEQRVGEIRVLKDLTYATHDGVALLCDVYLPQSPQMAGDDSKTGGEKSNARPAVLVIHGGGWAMGDKWSVKPYARALAEQGAVAVAMNYRHAPKYKFPAQIDDVRNALVWIKRHADEYQIDPERIGMFGYSAGGHLSCMIGTLVDAPWETLKKTTTWDKKDPRWEQIPKVCGVVGGGVPCDFRDLPPDNTAIAYFLGGSRRELPEVYKAASPAEHASPGDVPILFIHGTQDAIVPIASSRILYEAQLKVGVPSRFLALDGPGHMLTFISTETKSAAIEFLTQMLFPEKDASKKAASEKKKPPKSSSNNH